MRYLLIVIGISVMSFNLSGCQQTNSATVAKRTVNHEYVQAVEDAANNSSVKRVEIIWVNPPTVKVANNDTN